MDFTILANFSQIRQSETSLAELIILTNLRHILDISPKKVHFEIFLPLGGVMTGIENSPISFCISGVLSNVLPSSRL